MSFHFDFETLTAKDHEIALAYIGGKERQPDFTIAPDGRPYLHRWHVIPRDQTGQTGNVYFHIQVGDDPERPLHDHPWDNQSVILAGGYIERVWRPGWCKGWRAGEIERIRRVGDVVSREAEDAHHLKLLPGEPYTMTQFSTGPVRRKWGFYAASGWVPFDEFTEVHNNVSTWKGPKHG